MSYYLPNECWSGMFRKYNQVKKDILVVWVVSNMGNYEIFKTYLNNGN